MRKNQMQEIKATYDEEWDLMIIDTDNSIENYQKHSKEEQERRKG